jgi:outer membrane biogenesis lipoprotein LolB
MNASQRIFLGGCMLLLAACSAQDRADHAAERGDHVWKTQTQALEKARAIDELLEKEANKRKDTIEQQSY